MATFSPETETEPTEPVTMNFSDRQRCLQPREIKIIEEALRSVGEYGEVRLVIEKGRIRFLVTQKSIDILKRQPGNIDKNP